MPSIATSFYYRIAAIIGAVFIAALIITEFSPSNKWATAGYYYGRLRGEIPNQVHYVYLLSDPAADFNLEFKDFVSVYSISYHWRPHTIYIHTDATPETIERAKGTVENSLLTEENKWTRRIFSLPNIRVNYVVAPTQTMDTNVTIQGLEHKSDFVRIQAVHNFGGVYLDFDAHPIRPITALRRSGFAAIGGLQSNGQVQIGTFMAQRHSLLTEMLGPQQHIVYDGGWTTHSVDLMSSLGSRLVALPGEMLILEQDAFTPDSWSYEANVYMYQPHLDYPAAPLDHSYHRGENSDGDPNSVNDASDYPYDDDNSEITDRLNSWGKFPSWTRDFSRTYVVHAFSPSRQGQPIEGFEKISPRYILARQSNFARAVYPAVKDAWDRGIFDLDDY